MYHPGYIESCHEAKNAEWYRENNYNKDFCDKLEKGDFTPCGSSGGHLTCFVNGELTVSNKKYLDYRSIACCCFVAGDNCHNEKLKRRWTCCDQTIEGTMHDMIKIKGCKSISIIPNFTP